MKSQFRQWGEIGRNPELGACANFSSDFLHPCQLGSIIFDKKTTAAS